MKNKSVALILIVAFLSSGCATSPDKIRATYVSPLQYYGLSCEQIREEMIRVSAKVGEVTGVQQSEATKDAWAMGVGLILFWPALFFLMGSDKKAELGRLKGEYEALETVAIRKNCGFAAELEKAREEHKKPEAPSKETKEEAPPPEAKPAEVTEPKPSPEGAKEEVKPEPEEKTDISTQNPVD